MTNESYERVIEDLRKSLAWLDLVLANLNEGVLTLDKDLRIRFANDAMADILQVDRIQLLGKLIWEVLLLGRNGDILKQKEYAAILLDKRTFRTLSGSYTLRVAGKDVFVDVACGFIPKIEQLAVVIRDITRLKHDESQILLHQKVTQTANEAATVEQALQTSLDVICEYTGWPVGHAYLRSEAVDGILTSAKIWHLRNPRRFSRLRKISEQSAFTAGVGLPGRVLKSGKPVWIADVYKDPNFTRGEVAKDLNIKAGFAFPILIKKEVAGVLEFYSTEAIKPDETLMEIMVHVGTQLGRVIERTRSENERLQLMREQIARAEAESSEKRYRRLVESTNVIPWEADAASGNFTYVGPQAEKILGYPVEAWYGESFWPDHIHPDDRARAVKYCLDALQTKQDYEFEYRMLAQDGRTVWLRDIVSIVAKEDGTKTLTGFLLDVTERKSHEDELKESELRFRNLADTAPMYLAMADETGKAVYFNKPWLDFTGNELKDMLGLGWLRTLHPEDAQKFEKDFKRAFKERLPINEQYRFRKSDGEYRWMLAVGAPRLTPEGRFIGYFGTYTDFHELKEAQLAIEDNEERFRIFANNIHSLAWMANSDGWIFWYNQQWYEYTGTTFEEMQGWGWEKVHHPDHIERVVSFVKTAWRKGDTWELTFPLRGADGQYQWFLTRANAVKDATGKVVRWIGTNTNINDRIEAEAKLQQSRDSLTFLAEASRLLSASLDLPEIFETITRLAVPKLGDCCVVDILQGQPGAFKAVSIAHLDPGKAAAVKAFRDKFPLTMHEQSGLTNVIRTRRAQYYPEVTTGMLRSAVKNGAGLKQLKDMGIGSAICAPIVVRGTAIGAITFTTAGLRKKFSEVDLRTAEEFANRASSAIENARLYDASQKAVQLRDDFISVASHELKTPVTSLKMYVQVMRKLSEARGEDTRNMVKMDAQINKLTLLIQDLLNVSQLQSGKLAYQDGEFDLREVVEEVTDNLQPTAPNHILLTEGLTACSVWGDKDRIGQVLTNLLTNAIKYSPHADKVVIRLSSEKNCAQVTVQDFGIGIDKKHLDKLFERFYRVTDPEEKTYPGLGLGLYISNEIVKRHGGRMTVASSKGKGSQFSFTMPYRPAKPKSSPKSTKETTHA